MTTRRPTVQAWRWDYLCPEGWFPWVTAHDPDPRPRGWYVNARATCVPPRGMWDVIRARLGVKPAESDLPPHDAPHPDCFCGWHGFTELTEDVAVVLELFEAFRELTATQQPEVNDGLAVCLSRVTLSDVLPGAELYSGAAPTLDSIPDPPGTVRGHRMRYDSIFVDREWPTRLDHDYFPSPDWWPPTTYVPDLAEWVREQCAASVTDLLEGMADQ